MRPIYWEIGIFVLGWILLLLFQHELLITAAVAAAIVATLLVRYEQRELLLFVTGVAFGLLIEIGSDQFYQLQTWEQGLFFGYPLWLFLFWGYAFILIRRVGNEIVR